MVKRQRELIAKGNYVAEGRDIGTVVSPDSPLKVFLTASEAERARRRADESGESLSEVQSAMRDRDRRDQERADSPLRLAERALLRSTRRIGRRTKLLIRLPTRLASVGSRDGERRRSSPHAR